ncbi:hypothetical protein FBEOM_9695 [Fusarium beomiforme]|uniref:Uncharacterized protein n=1 Tax=Fusarium beomiforme TaxID=44412 RepID=A0A9P5AEJ3_9HYPO|nr:hypothetical protein FBEOM_9695 [Fusarium beomiforme]
MTDQTESILPDPFYQTFPFVGREEANPLYKLLEAWLFTSICLQAGFLILIFGWWIYCRSTRVRDEEYEMMLRREQQRHQAVKSGAQNLKGMWIILAIMLGIVFLSILGGCLYCYTRDGKARKAKQIQEGVEMA